MAAGPANDVNALNGLFKKQFHDQLEDLKPQHVILQNSLIDWVPADKQNGEFYGVPTVLRSNQGVTYLGESGDVGTLKSAKPGVMKEAQIKGSEINIRGQLAYKALSQAATAGPRAFKKSSAWLVEDLAYVAHTRIEIATLYGQSGLGTVESVTDVTPGSVATVVITAPTFAPGMWACLEGATLDSFTGTTKNNATGVITVTSVDTSTRTLTVSYSGTLASEITAGDELFFEGANAGAGVFNEMCGLFKQMSTTSGTLFAIDRGAYSLMKGNVVGTVGTLTKAKLVAASMKAVDKGCMSDLVVLVSTAGFATLNAEDMALRQFDQSYSPEKSQSGSKELIYESVNGSLKVVCHPMVKPGHAFIINTEDVLYIGSSKPTFEIPGMSEQFFRLVQDANAVELQNYSDLAVYVLKPAQTVILTGITQP